MILKILPLLFLLIPPLHAQSPLPLPELPKAHLGKAINTPTLYPLAWSKNGKYLALLTHTTGEPATNLARLEIINLVTDKVVFEKQWQWDSDGTSSPVWTKLLAETGREMQSRSFVPISKPMPKLIDPRFKQDLTFAPESSLTLAVSQGVRTKTVCRRDLTAESEFDTTHASKLVGFLSGPNPDRVAFVLTRTVRGLEGQLSRKFIIVGAGVGKLF